MRAFRKEAYQRWRVNALTSDAYQVRMGDVDYTWARFANLGALANELGGR